LPVNGEVGNCVIPRHAAEVQLVIAHGGLLVDADWINGLKRSGSKWLWPQEGEPHVAIAATLEGEGAMRGHFPRGPAGVLAEGTRRLKGQGGVAPQACPRPDRGSGARKKYDELQGDHEREGWWSMGRVVMEMEDGVFAL
jgi:hypothetical protein